MGGRSSSSGLGNNSYTARSESTRVTLPSGASSESFGEGNMTRNGESFHVYLTDRVGGLFVDRGTVGGYTIGQTVSGVTYEGIQRDDGRIIAAHVYPNNRGIDYTVEFPENSYSRRGRTSFSKETLDKEESAMDGRSSSSNISNSGNNAQTRSIPASSVSVGGESNYRFSNGRAPRGTGNWAFNIGGQEVFISGSYTQAKAEARRRAAKAGISRITLLT